MVKSKFLRLVFAALLCLGSFLAGCVSDSGSVAAGAGGLPSGHYKTGTDGDDLYHYDQYFVVLDGGKWEWVEYGVTPGSATLCQVTRQGGTYSVQGDSLIVTGERAGKSVEKCGMTQADWDAYPFEEKTHVQMSFPVRNITAGGFEANGLFYGTAGWKTYAKISDPYGFYP